MTDSVRDIALKCKQAAVQVAELSEHDKNALLHAMADELDAQAATVLAANAEDMKAAREKGIGEAMLDRLALDKKRLAGVADALRFVASLPDPVGEVTESHTSDKGFQIERVRVPLGVVGMIYEARPNVTADAAALCLKAGNGVILRGGKEAVRSNTAIAACLRKALRDAGLDEHAVTLMEDLSREAMMEMMQLNDILDLLIPRGGEGLIRFVNENARVPVIKHYKGVCHLYVDASADLDKALDILIDGKTTRPAACNSLENLLVSKDVADTFLPRAVAALRKHGVEVLGDEASHKIVPDLDAATDEDYATEFLSLKIAVRVVDDVDAAIAHIRQYGSDHTEVIAAEDEAVANRFVHALRAAVVMINTSSRFSDGGELGLGAEIGISTTRLHAYGPMGAEALTIERFVLRGHGEVRHAESKAAA
ncbi:glutamate-5-semialdehyde dehydrogenase [Oleiagrimonas soli]|uniref:Gamma-glutamyl phosphate reductase n=1 Tax=Oleiagrimonas soli TaxID=1543381 RepID=A0A099CWK6_9GAMM|nr:glutamate-5-semialdehyde dehydrogenase [Oleiagrimonas soli]KGI78021.1 gamma-glutamyl phosphate reductase [Oleiagrimonas soli]MBB6183588.1 glutamate-5-semialdehyde dehydrogenase [Oleiagrimonas soli]